MLGTTYALSEGYRLTEESSETDIGGVVLNRRLDLSTSFSFDMELYTGDTGSDGAGMGLTFHNDSRGKTALSSSLEESMGFGLTDNITPSLNIELDTTNNGFADISDNHWAVILDGDVRQSSSGNIVESTTSFGYSIEDNDYYQATLAWNATTNTLTFTFNGSQLFSTVYDIPSHVGTDYPWFVITAATGNSEDNEHSACFKSEPAYAPQNYVIETADSGYNSLREAINYVNANSGIDNVDFYIPGTGPFVITAGSSLPTITDSGVTIDGTSQAGTSCGDLWNGDGHTIMVELDGPGSGYGLTSTTSDTTVKGLSITDFEVGVLASVGSSNTVVQCNYLGLNPDGTAAGNTAAGVASVGANTLVGGLSTGEGNVASGNVWGAVSYDGATGFMVRGNFIGTNPSGTSAVANNIGVNSYTGTVTWSDVTDNLISGNSEDGIVLNSDDTVTGSSGDALIVGNYIGVSRTGNAILANGESGIELNSATVSGFTIGGATSNERNIIAGNSLDGITLTDVTDVDVLGNYIGLGADGSTSIYNRSDSIELNSVSSVNIGDNTSDGRNVLATSEERGVIINGTNSSISISGNYIGTDATGNAGIDKNQYSYYGSSDGIGVYGSVSTLDILNNVIGNYETTQIEFWNASGSNVTIQGNYLDVGADGTTDISNSATAIESADNSAALRFGGSISISNLVIGGTGAGEGNIIANNDNLGVFILNSQATSFVGNTVYGNVSAGIRIDSGATSVSILQNSIHSNGGIGIDLGTDGVTANDAGDGDSGANNLLNFPVLNSLTASGTSLFYDLNLDAATNADGYRIEFFVSDAASATGNGSGETYLGYLDVTGPGADTNYTGTLTMSQSLSSGDIITVTATAISGAGYGPTSEFSGNIAVVLGSLVVTNTNASGSGSLAEAISLANADAGLDEIEFDISGTGPFTITLSSGLTVTDADVTIDATTQTGTVCGDLWNGDGHTIMVELDGPGSDYGITSSAANTTIKGLSITDFQVGIVGDSASSGLTVQCNYIGLNPDGTAGANTGAGVAVQGSSPLIGGLTSGQGNVISSNYYGVLSDNGASGIMLRGNFIGSDPTGASARANEVGINNFTGATTWSDITQNLISGNTAQGILFDSGDTITGSSGDLNITGNYIGLNRAGDAALANGGDGLSFDAGTSGVTIGGIVDSARNLISGNGTSGIWLNGASDITIYGNYIGLDATGTTAVGNSSVGIASSGANNLTIGTGVSAGRNVIAGNGSRAIQPQGTYSSLTISGNYVGTDATGNVALSNGWAVGTNVQDGISFDGGVNATTVSITDNIIGGYNAALLEFWGGTATDVTVQGNSLGIGADGASDISTGTSTEAVIYLGGGTMDWSNFTIGGSGAGEGNIVANGGSDGIEITTAGTSNTIVGNAIYDNAGNGIEVISSSGISIDGNNIGLAADDTTVLGNSQNGILLTTASNITIGEAGSGNVIVGNSSNGILGTDTSSVTIQGNLIGVLMDGVSDGGNLADGIRFASGPNDTLTIGGTASDEENVIGYNGGDGIELSYVTTASLLGNSIGASADGSGAAGNGGHGIYLFTSSAIDIGDGTTAGLNYINSNTNDGVNIDDSTSVALYGNAIGLSSDGITARGNQNAGIRLLAGTASTSAVIGGTTSGQGNIIANNSEEGITLVDAATSATILSNLIYANTGLPIDLGDDGLTDNDSGDGDTGANDLLNRADLDGLYAEGSGTLSYFFTLDAPVNSDGYRVELFRTGSANSDNAGDLEEFILAIDTGSHAGGAVRYAAQVAESSGLTIGDILTATVTSFTGATTYGVTSEPSSNFELQALYEYTDIPLTGTSYGSSRHEMSPYVYLGSVVSGDAAAFDSADADGDDDDGVTIPSGSQGADIQISFDVAGDGGYLSGWLDWNGDGDFADTVDGISEVLASDIQDGGADDADGSVNGTIVLDVTIPSSATTSQTFARFRWSTESGLDSVQDAQDGEVEDFSILISGTAVLTASQSNAIYDPSSLGLYAVPGNDLVISISATNIGGGSSDTDSIQFVDEIPSDLIFYNGTTTEFGGNTIGWTETDTGLSFSDSTDVAYSNAGTRPTDFSECSYTPTSGYDDNVRYICFNPKGAMLAGDPDPEFTLQYRVRIR
ncbi:MAG: hypothetical protein CMK07_00420 [Ponticaulis sp.]|nr:hypothetical protein [Ponticaulis sp.]